MAKYKVDITGINTSEIEVLSNEEMTNLFVEYRNGNLYVASCDKNLKGIYKVLPSDVVIIEPLEEEKGLLVA